MNAYPTLTTERLLLRQPQAHDIASIVQLANEPAVANMTLNIPHPYAETDAIYWLNAANQGFASGLHWIFAMELRQAGQFIGGIGLTIEPRFHRAEVGYWVGKPFWNHGFATEALRAVLAFGFETLELHKIFATHLVGNLASGRVMQHVGMQWEAELHQHVRKKGQYFDLMQYQLTRPAYLASPAGPTP
ncbi:GNAT family N-acetyltransferase [Hymenobacter aerilatus]|uniref:GNAT family N-acetyltransferase n=1 Tax=Hymenobacter aerilatus TaxID=2932251 RepID=A0A8T9SQN7_9BACT|nr:GNAT family N-acetyltransferase [Hymenobacter aerilatus]UOR04115.1 GNAT family N-acetyltransferase [Hymenobacter aerilatus]